MARPLAFWLARPASRHLRRIYLDSSASSSQPGWIHHRADRAPHAILQVPPILLFLWTPVVDVKLRRRTWPVLGALATALLLLIARQIGTTHVRLLTALLFFAGVVVALVPASCGGLMATLLSAAAQAKASGWNQAGNWGGVGLGGVAVLWLVARFSLPAAGLAAATLVALPAILAFTITEPAPVASSWIRGFAQFRKAALALFRAPRRRWSIFLLVAPGSTCAAQTLPPALASHYGVGATGALWTNGVAGGVVLGLGALCSVLIPADWVRRLTYAGAGLTNAFRKSRCSPGIAHPFTIGEPCSTC